MEKISNKDYISILNYYKLTIPKSNAEIKLKAENIIASKLCRCIKKLDSKGYNNSKSIGICTKTILNRKGYSRKNFKCKKPHIKLIKKHTRKKIY